MRVAVYHGLPPIGGAFRVLAEFVARTRHDIVVYTRRPETAGLFELPGDVEVRRLAPVAVDGPLRGVRELLRLPRAGADMAREIDAAGHDAVFCFINEMVSAPEVLPYLGTPSLFYSPEPWRDVYEPAPEFARDRSVAGALSRRGLGPTSFLRRRQDRRNMRAAGRVVTHSRYTSACLKDVYGRNSDVVALGVDARRFSPGSEEREGFVLSVGALHPLKGHQFVVEAVSTLPSPRPAVVVVGDRGSVAEPLRALARELDVSLEVRSGLPDDELLGLYRRAGAMACGQIREPFGLITLEAMATATPVVAVAEGGFLETVDDERTGLLAPRDPQRFGQALSRVLTDRALAERLGVQGREAACTRWTWERAAQGLDDLLDEVAA